MITKQDLIDFEDEVVKLYKEGNTYGPVHLSGCLEGKQEDALIKIFKNIKKNDFIFTTHRSHYHALLKSNDRDWLMNEIIVKAESSHINSAKYKIFSSAIVGGIVPIALGTAWGIKMKNDKFILKRGRQLGTSVENTINLIKNQPHVWCFVGDMAAEMGCVWEAVKYAKNLDLPITFVIEDNDLGCNTPTKDVWGECQMYRPSKYLIHYKYVRKYPHYGIGSWITFKKKKVKGVGDYNAHNIK